MADQDPKAEAQGAPKGRLDRFRQEPVAGIIDAIVAIPDGLASAAMVGVNPVLGLYTSVFGPGIGGLLTSTQRMQIAATSASAIAAAEAIGAYEAAQRESAMMVLVMLIGAFLVILGLLGAGRLVRFVSHAVMTGFLFGVAITLILDQIPQLIGFESSGESALTRIVTLPMNLDQISWHTTLIGCLAAVVLVGASRLRTNLGPLVALVVPTILLLLLGWGDVETVASQGEIPLGLPWPQWPDLSLVTLDLVGSALAISAIIAIQAAGVSQGAPNVDGTPSNVSRDMVAQGVANLAGGPFSAIPAGGSVGQTALNVSLGARSRWASVFSGLFMLAIVCLIPGLVGLVPMPALAALMIMAGIGALNAPEALWIWRTAGGARWALIITFLATVVTSIPIAVGIGVVVTIVYFIVSSATDVSIHKLTQQADGSVREDKAPATLADREIVVLDVEGSLFFAGARTLAEILPSPDEADAPVVILRMRGYTPAGSTLIDVLDDYAHRLGAVGGALYLSGVGDDLAEQLRRSGKLDLGNGVHVIQASPQLGASTHEAVRAALKRTHTE